MARVCPGPPASPSYTSPKREFFTVWMKSLIFNGYGCTVFDSRGEIVYRIDNYSSKCSNRVHLMDLRGRILFTILKKVSLFGRWEGRASASLEEEHLWFRVARPCSLLKRRSPCDVVVGRGSSPTNCYEIQSLESGYRIVDPCGGLVAEVKQKLSSSGLLLGDDVFSMVVEADVDHSLITGLVVVHSLMSQSM